MTIRRAKKSPKVDLAAIGVKDSVMKASDFQTGEAVLLNVTGPIEVAVARTEGESVIVEFTATPDQLQKLAEGTSLDGGSGLA